MSIPVPPWWAAALLASVSVACTEYLHRVGGFTSFLNGLPYLFFFYMLTGYALFYCWRDSPSFMLAWIAFFGINLAIRLVNVHYFVGEPLNSTTLIGVALVTCGAYLVKVGTT